MPLMLYNSTNKCCCSKGFQGPIKARSLNLAQGLNWCASCTPRQTLAPHDPHDHEFGDFFAFPCPAHVRSLVAGGMASRQEPPEEDGHHCGTGSNDGPGAWHQPRPHPGVGLMEQKSLLRPPKVAWCHIQPVAREAGTAQERGTATGGLWREESVPCESASQPPPHHCWSLSHFVHQQRSCCEADRQQHLLHHASR